MKIAVIGTGYVGLVSAACFAELGHEVYGVDIDEEKIKKCKKGESPIYEPGLQEILQEGLRNGRLSFTTDLTEVLPNVKIVFSAVATPPGEGYKADLRAVFTVAETVARHADHDIVFVNKSTVPVGTGKLCEEKISEILKERGVNFQVPVISNPEFLREGMAVSDTIMPDRVVIGINHNEWARDLMEDLYRPITRVGKPLVFMNRESSEIVKYAANSLLATKISFINMLTELTEKTGANIRDVARGVGLDTRIGPRFLHAGIGYGGSCFPKDVKALLATASELGIPMDIVEATDKINARQRKRFFKQITDLLPANANVGILGLSFKPKTDDMRAAPSLDLIPELIEKGHNVKVFDPAAMEVAKPLLPAQVTFCKDALEAVKDADSVVVLTEWDEFRGIDLVQLKQCMRGNDLFDGRNIYEPDEVREVGLEYHGIGIG
ncbi:MAG: UDP-glucose/GDP-mannose dehydrogenase family protein [Candidatus Peribacteraceae bacterium]|jgi:UDPglucose 6-dehydrogenase|nr:UDP-glucose/GDP-mannose dehydrogenase family protein [Candidatus Peribacteraceae bacterium]MDP7454248.1 UDP-glucose/GDP-mannose dehydrogenase family protein [Candidatus Peribacteraceae bacterium]MDP7645840.1 UDP-glucose/GDP-mannose dehydrogenase family protein [Candidatus Peribacteraceae bacterium]